MVQKIKKFFEVLKMVLLLVLLVLFVVLPLRLFVVILQPVVRVTLVGSA